MKVKKYLIRNKNENRRLLAPVFHNEEKGYLLCNCCFVAIYQTTVHNGHVESRYTINYYGGLFNKTDHKWQSNKRDKCGPENTF
jgi:hypothetical protein